MTRRLVAVTAALASVLALASCGENDEPAHTKHTASNGDVYNEADVQFATDMIPHHAQALAMVDLTLNRQLDPEVQRLAEDIREAQAPEIEQMTDWLTAWDEAVPETMRDHTNAHGEGDMEMDSDMPGMMSGEQMSELETAGDAEFQALFLDMMIEHHEGAIEMARTEQDEGAFDPATALAEAIEASQSEEISLMEGLL